MSELRDLSIRECESLLRSREVGRVALSTATGPHIVPVNYAVVPDALIIRTSPYSLLGTHGRDAILAFEVDGVDRADERGWSVQARGRAEVVTDRAELDRLRTAAPMQPWAGGARPLHLRLRWSELTGRRLVSGETPDVDLQVSG